MPTRDDIRDSYKVSEILSHATSAICVVNIVVSVCIILPEFYEMRWLSVVSVIAILLYFLLNTINELHFWYNAEALRRIDAISDGFAIPLNDIMTVGYYDDQRSPSLHKYFTNVFESCYYTKNISEKMLFRSSATILIGLIIFIGAIIASSNLQVLNVIANTLFATSILFNGLGVIVYYFRIKKIYNNMYEVLITLGCRSRESEVLMLSYAIDYEATKSYYKVRLSKRIFLKWRTELSAKWNDMEEGIIFHDSRSFENDIRK